MSKKRAKSLSEIEFMALAEFRYQIRKYLRHMEEKARKMGHNPQQYQLLLAVKGLPKATTPTISAMAERMQLNHNSMVELVDRCEKRALLRRTRSGPDHRQVTLEITPDGEALMRRYASAARHEFDTTGPSLAKSIHRLLHDKRSPKRFNGDRRQKK